MTEILQAVQDLDTDIDRSCRYHSRRRAFLDTLHKTIAGVVILSGSSAVAAIFGNHSTFGIVAASATAVLTTIDLVVGLSHRARDHEVLYRQFKQLAADMAAISAPTAEDLARTNHLSIRRAAAALGIPRSVLHRARVSRKPPRIGLQKAQ